MPQPSDVRIVGLALAAMILVLSQPEINRAEASRHRGSDCNSMTAILYGGLLSYIVPIVDWAYFGDSAARQMPLGHVATGAALIMAGLTIRIWAIRALGRFFTATVQIVKGHRLIQSGPYRLVRHPSYTGAVLAMLGHSLVLGSTIGLATTALFMGAAYFLRIRAEEHILIDNFGEEYRRYQARSKRLVPLVW